MDTGAMVAGIIGGVIGIAAGVLAIGLGSLGAASEAGASNSAIVPGGLAIILAVVGAVGGAMAKRRPGMSVALQGVPAIAGVFLLKQFWIPSGLLLAIGAALTLAVARRR